MDKKNKPTPINRKQFYDTLPEPYQIPEQVVQPYDNTPKPPIYDNQGEPDLVRGNQISMKGDNSKVIRIGLEDHDEAILWYIENHLKPTVEINGNKREVPVLMGSPERWKSIQKDGFYRDKNGKIQTPLIILKRESFEKNKTIGNKLDGNKVNNVQYFKQGYSKRNSYDNFSILQNQIPQEEYKVGIIPDYITLTYKLLIFTDYVEHMNQLIEAIEFASDSYWGDKERFQFRTTITNYPTPITVESGNDRASRSELTLTINGYIIPNSINVYEAAPSPKSYNVTKFKFEENLLSVINKETVKVESISIPNNSVPQQNIDTSSFVLIPSFNNFTSSYNTGSFTGSFIGDGSQLTGIPTQSINLDYLLTTSSFNSFTSSYNTGSFQGNLNGTSSYSNISNTASYYNESDPIFSLFSSSIIYTSSFNNYTSSVNLQQVLNNGKSATIVSENGDTISIDFNTEEASQGCINTTITSFGDTYQSTNQQYSSQNSKFIGHQDVEGFNSVSSFLETAITNVAIEKESYSREEIATGKSGGVTYKQLPPAIDNTPIVVNIEMPYKEVSGTYRIATIDDIPSGGTQTLQDILNNGSEAIITSVANSGITANIFFPYNEADGFQIGNSIVGPGISVSNNHSVGGFINNIQKDVEVSPTDLRYVSLDSNLQIESTNLDDGDFIGSGIQIAKSSSDGVNNYNGIYSERRAIPKIGTDVVIEYPYKEISGNYRVATQEEIPSISGLATETYVDDGLALKQNKTDIVCKTTSISTTSTTHAEIFSFPIQAGERWYVDFKALSGLGGGDRGGIFKFDAPTGATFNGGIQREQAAAAVSHNPISGTNTFSVNVRQAVVAAHLTDKIWFEVYNPTNSGVVTISVASLTAVVFNVPKASLLAIKINN